jgi:N,N'-diacetyllegionaminate synthase
MNSVRIGRSTIGAGHPCYLISEIGNNHGGSVELALRLIEESARAGANAVKFQTFTGKDIVSPNVKSDTYPGWDVSRQFERWVDFVDSLALPRSVYPELIRTAHSLGMDFISTPTSMDTASFLEDVGADALKIASMDLTYHPLLEHVAGLDLPVVLSTGMGTIGEIEEAVGIFAGVPLIVLHCVSEYPLPSGSADLNNLVGLQDYFRIPVGFSDHSPGHLLDVLAVALGAVAIEKHFTLDRASPFKAEHHFSLEPTEFANLAAAVRESELALGSRIRNPSDRKNALGFRRSLQFVRDMEAGEVIGEQDVVALRPGNGLHPRYLRQVVGQSLGRACNAYTPFTWDDLRPAV